jgi:hypothetical protein
MPCASAPGFRMEKATVGVASHVVCGALDSTFKNVSTSAQGPVERFQAVGSWFVANATKRTKNLIR